MYKKTGGSKNCAVRRELHSLEMLLLSLDENTTEEEIKERKKNCVIRPVFEKAADDL